MALLCRLLCLQVAQLAAIWRPFKSRLVALEIAMRRSKFAKRLLSTKPSALLSLLLQPEHNKPNSLTLAELQFERVAKPAS